MGYHLYTCRLGLRLSRGIYELYSFSSKDKEIAGLQQKVEEDASEVASLQKRIRDLEAKIGELEEELESERSAKSRVNN